MKTIERGSGAGRADGPNGAEGSRPATAPVRRPRERSDDGNAFIPDPEGGPARVDDDLAEYLAEGFVHGATQDDDAEDTDLDGVVPEELGGPFIETSGAVEFAKGTDGANPSDAEREPIPRPIAGLIHDPDLEDEGEEDDDDDKTEELDVGAVGRP